MNSTTTQEHLSRLKTDYHEKLVTKKEYREVLNYYRKMAKALGGREMADLKIYIDREINDLKNNGKELR